MPKPDSIDSIVKKWTCEMATDKNLPRCPLRKIPTGYYGSLTLKFDNHGNIVLTELNVKEQHGR